MLLSRTAFILACLVSVKVAHADTFTYTFSFADPEPTQSAVANFTYTSPILITADTIFGPTTCSINGADCSSARINPGLGLISIDASNGGDSLTIQDLPASSFTVGDHPISFGDFSITQTPTESPVPEPPSMALLGSGLLGCGHLLRKQWRGRSRSSSVGCNEHLD